MSDQSVDTLSSEETLSPVESGEYVLKFISGKYEGGEFPVEEGSEIVIGRSSELDMVLVEDMVSRRHARIAAKNGALEIEDFGSTNGTFVNGEKIRQAELEEGDRILIGTNIIKLVRQDADASETLMETSASVEDPVNGAQTVETDRVDEGDIHRSNERNSTGAGSTLTGSLSGLIQEVPLTDLLQLFSTSQKTGLLVVRGPELGKVYLRDGRVYYASINDDENISPYKAIYRMLAWEEGSFSLEPDPNESFEDEINESIENLLMEGMRQLDEMKNLGDNVPDYEDKLVVNKPLVPPLRSLEADKLDTFQLVFNYEKVAKILNKSLASDLETMEDIVHLMREDYISVG